MALFLSIAVLRTAAADIFRVLDANDGLADNQVQHILQIPDGRLIVTTLGNINIYDGARFDYIHKKNRDGFELSEYHGAYHVYIGRNDLLWVKTTLQLVCFDLKRRRYVDNIRGLFRKMGITQRVVDVFLDADREVWAVTPRGLQRNGHDMFFALATDAGELQDLEVMGNRLYLFFSKGEVMVYALQSGKLLLRRAAYPASRSHLFNNTSLVVKGADGILYQLRTGFHSLFLAFDTKSGQWHTLMETPYTLHTLALTKDRHAYITCPKGYWLFDMDSGKGKLFTQLHTTEDGIISNAGLNSVFCDSQGGIWMGTYNRGLLYNHPASYRFTTTVTGSGNARQDDYHVNYHGEEYNMVVTDRRGWTWGATNDGLRLTTKDGKGMRSIYKEDGLVNNFVHSVVEDRKGNIWAGTSCGISRIEIDHNGALAFSNFGSDDGTLDGEYMNGRAKLLRDGHILMTGINGYTRFYPDSVRQQRADFSPILSDIQLFGKSLSPGKKYDGEVLVTTSAPYVKQLQLNYRQNSLSLVFSALNYINPKQTVYRFRLIGADNRWHTVESGSSNGMVDDKGLLHLSFANIMPGTYTIQVMASNNIHQWSGTIRTMTFTINSPWWQATAAYVIYVLIAMALTAMGIVIYLHVMKRKIQQGQKEEALLQRIQDLIRQVEEGHGDAQETEPDNHDGHPDGDEESSGKDAEFVRKAAQLVEAHINEQGYSVSELSRDLFMERTGLYKKLTALIDESPTLFIRHIRLQKAAELISEGKLSIGEIAFRTGFSSSSYLSKCFQDEFGCKPSEYKTDTGGEA